jgi:hypothetical protein
MQRRQVGREGLRMDERGVLAELWSSANWASTRAKPVRVAADDRLLILGADEKSIYFEWRME